MKPEAQYSGFIERFQSYSKEYSTLKDATYAALKDAILLNMFPSEITETEISFTSAGPLYGRLCYS